MNFRHRGKLANKCKLARCYANKIMRDSIRAIAMLDGADVTAINSNPSAIVDVFSHEARNAMKLKVLEPLE